jgi:dATP pyrophosphohydrolase
VVKELLTTAKSPHQPAPVTHLQHPKRSRRRVRLSPFLGYILRPASSKGRNVSTMSKPPKIPESVLVVIHTPEMEVLVIERFDRPGFWQSVTGSKDHINEPLVVTAAREVAEETGIEIGGPGVPERSLLDWHHQIEYDIYPEWRHRYAEGVVRNVEHQFSLLVPHCVEVKLAPREHTAFVWLPLREAAAKCFSSSNREAILQLPERLAEHNR